MLNYIFWDKKSDLYPPAGSKKTPADIFAEWGWAENPSSYVVIGMSGGVMCSFDSLDVLKGVYNIEEEDPKLALEKINIVANEEPGEPEPSAQERIAAALEYQNLISF